MAEYELLDLIVADHNRATCRPTDSALTYLHPGNKMYPIEFKGEQMKTPKPQNPSFSNFFKFIILI